MLLAAVQENLERCKTPFVLVEGGATATFLCHSMAAVSAMVVLVNGCSEQMLAYLCSAFSGADIGLYAAMLPYAPPFLDLQPMVNSPCL